MKKVKILLVLLVCLLGVLAFVACSGDSNNSNDDDNNSFNKIYVTFMSDGTEYAKIEVKPDAIMPIVPTKEGNTFGGWYLDDTTFLQGFTSLSGITVSMTVYARWVPENEGDNSGTSRSNAIVLQMDKSIVAIVSPAIKYYDLYGVWYSFTPIITGLYTIKSTSSTSGDSLVLLFDSLTELHIDSDFDSGNGNNFSLTCELTANTNYYFFVAHYLANSGTITFILSRETGTTEPNGVTEGLSYRLLDNDTKYEVVGIGTVTVTEIIIPSVHNGKSVTNIGSAAFEDCDNLTSIIVPKSVTSIGLSAFFGCNSLENITIPFVGNTLNGKSYTNFGYIFGASEYMHYSYGYGIRYQNDYIPSSLKTVTIIGGNIIGEDAFRGCNNLTNIYLPNGITNIGYAAFEDCVNLTNIAIPNSVKSIGANAFYNCCSLTESITIPDGVTEIGIGTFYNCSSLMSITIPSSVTSIYSQVGWYGAFYGCANLSVTWHYNSALTAREFNSYLVNVVFPADVTRISDYAFYGCVSLTDSFEMPNGIMSIGDFAFYGCTELTSITIPNSVTDIGEEAFYFCKGLMSVTIPNSVMNINVSTFSHCSGLTRITFPSSITSIGDSAFYDCRGLTSVSFESKSRLTSIGYAAFYNCIELRSITIPPSVTSIKNSAFSSCTALTDIYYTAISCEDFVGYDVSFPSSGVFDKAGTSGTGIKVIIGRLVTKIPAYMFVPVSLFGSPNVISVVFEEESQCLSIGNYAFYSCGLESITIPSSILNIGDYVFNNCSRLTSIAFSLGITNIGNYAFSDCDELINLTLPSSVMNIGFGTFSGCRGLTSLVIPRSVVDIGGSAFYDCRGLTRIVLFNNIKNIGHGAFGNCLSLTIYAEVASKPSGWDSRWNLGLYYTPVVWGSSGTDLKIDENGRTSMTNVLLYFSDLVYRVDKNMMNQTCDVSGETWLIDKVIIHTEYKCIVMKKGETIVFVFQGSDDGWDWAGNILLLLSNVAHPQTTYLWGLNDFMDDYLKDKSFDIYITGHSLGGHLALYCYEYILLAGYGNKVIGIETFNALGIAPLDAALMWNTKKVINHYTCCDPARKTNITGLYYPGTSIMWEIVDGIHIPNTCANPFEAHKLKWFY